jgi:hypothetical protein
LASYDEISGFCWPSSWDAVCTMHWLDHPDTSARIPALSMFLWPNQEGCYFSKPRKSSRCRILV